MDIELCELLSTFNVPVRRQGGLADDEEYPQTFFTYWNNSEYGNSHYDNNTLTVAYDFDVNVYSTDINTTYELLNNARKLLKANGWTIAERGHDVGSDEPTHTGRGMNVIKIIKEVD